ncbi:hypothetical protein [Oligoflexus tunisiensis]|uniref:hypothetical protein n=1 Tax=Oligoflexus tunisiensis TaxID=708132 RepID=UPI00114D1716|nr:hypothetical protein [Oligoflexus tunisiensis]
MRSIPINDYKYRNAFGEMIFDQVIVSVPDGWSNEENLENADYSISATEILRMERELALRFFKNQYRPILLGQRTITPDELKAIQDILGVNRSDLGKLLGLHKASVTNIFKGKAMSPTLANLIMERLGMELGRPGSARLLLNGGTIPDEEELASQEISRTRFGVPGHVA